MPYLTTEEIEKATPYGLYHLARATTTKDERTLIQTEICKCTIAQPIYWFAKDVEGADLELLGEALRKTLDPNYIKLFLKNVKVSAALELKLEKQLTLLKLKN